MHLYLILILSIHIVNFFLTNIAYYYNIFDFI